jgi:hypothetical protein
MDILKLIQELGALYHIHGNIQVGYRDSEFGCFNKIESISYKKSSGQRGGVSDDDESLLIYFIGIE